MLAVGECFRASLLLAAPVCLLHLIKHYNIQYLLSSLHFLYRTVCDIEMILCCYIIDDLYVIPPEEEVLAVKHVEDSVCFQVLSRAWISSALFEDIRM